MQPNNQQFSSDYLDSIASQPQVKTLNPFALWGIIGGVLVLAIVVVLAIAGSSGAGTTNLAGVGSQLKGLRETSQEAQEKIKNGQLRSVNGSLILVLTNANRELTGPLTAAEIDLEAPDKNATVALVNTEMEELKSRLEDARLNAIYDRTYAREMTFAIKTLRSDMSVVYNATRSNDLKEVIETTDTNLEPLLESFENYRDI